MTYYALYCALTDLGYSTTIISRPRSSGKPPIMPEKVYEKNPYPQHALKLEFKDKDAMFAMNEVCDSFVVGSDQLFNADLYYILLIHVYKFRQESEWEVKKPLFNLS